MIEKGLGRSDPLIALGGGVIGDMTGFAAATYLRGVPYVQVPTTLLAQVDSSVGGKTGVDHRLGKNLIGAFYQPQLVWIDLATLTTLPNRQIRAGFAEIVKYGAIADKRLFDTVARLSKKEIEHDRFLTSSELSRIIRRSCDIKARIVNADEKETLGIRSLLNFGHTVGHAIEAASTYETYLHGEAIAIGMVIAARASRRLDLCEDRDVEALQGSLERLGLATELPSAMKKKLSPHTLIQYIARDKKKCGDKIQFVVLERLGKAGLRSLELDRLGELLKGCL
jgi:3-dehydroquinate synthase